MNNIILPKIANWFKALGEEVKFFPQNMAKTKDGLPTKPVQLLNLYGLTKEDLIWVFDNNGYKGVVLTEAAEKCKGLSNFVSRQYGNDIKIGSHILRLKK